jgi:hypothetical protein
VLPPDFFQGRRRGVAVKTKLRIGYAPEPGLALPTLLFILGAIAATSSFAFGILEGYQRFIVEPRLTEEVARLRSEKTALQMELTQSLGRISELEREASDRRREAADLRRENSELRNNAPASLQAENSKLRQQAQALQNENSKLKLQEQAVQYEKSKLQERGVTLHKLLFEATKAEFVGLLSKPAGLVDPFREWGVSREEASQIISRDIDRDPRGSSLINQRIQAEVDKMESPAEDGE